MRNAKDKKRKEKFAINDLANFSVNISKLMYESEKEGFENISDLEQDLEGVETNFKFSKRKAVEMHVAHLAPEERKTRIERARERLRSKKVYQEDDVEGTGKQMINLSITPTKI